MDDSDDEMEVPKDGGPEPKFSTKERLALLKEVRDKCSILVADGVVESFPFYSFQEEIDAKMESFSKEVQSEIPIGVRIARKERYMSRLLAKQQKHKAQIDKLEAYLEETNNQLVWYKDCLLYTSPSPRDRQKSRMPSSA